MPNVGGIEGGDVTGLVEDDRPGRINREAVRRVAQAPLVPEIIGVHALTSRWPMLAACQVGRTHLPGLAQPHAPNSVVVVLAACIPNE